jgi:hypothetical protein
MRSIPAIIFASAALLAACAAPASETPAHEVDTHTRAAATQPVILPSGTPVLPAPSPTATSLAPTLAPLDLTSDLETIRLRMLHSHENWRSLWIQIEAVEFPPEGSDQLVGLQRLQVWIRQPGEVFLISGSLGDADPDYVFISDGARYLQADLATGATQEGDVAPYILEPFAAPEQITDTVTPHPLDGMIGYPAGSMIFPTGLAQRQGTYELIGEDTLTGRAALIVDFTPEPTGLISDRFRIDALTGVLLRHQVLGKTGGGERVESDLTVSIIVYEPEIPPGLFSLEIPENLHFQESPE